MFTCPEQTHVSNTDYIIKNNELALLGTRVTYSRECTPYTSKGRKRAADRRRGGGRERKKENYADELTP